MPIFEYACGDCGREFEVFVTAERAPECPGCKGTKLAKMPSSPGMVGANGGQKDPAPFRASGGCGAGTCGCRPN